MMAAWNLFREVLIEEGKKRMLAALGDLKLISDHPKLHGSQRGGRPAVFLLSSL